MNTLIDIMTSPLTTMALLAVIMFLLLWRVSHLERAIEFLRLDIAEIYARLEDEAEAWEFTPDEDEDDERTYADSGDYRFTPPAARHE